MEGCDRKHLGHGYCSLHHSRWVNTGDPLKTRERAEREPCIVDGCERRRHGHGYCSMHYDRWRAKGKPPRLRVWPPNEHRDLGSGTSLLIITAPDGRKTTTWYDSADRDLLMRYRWGMNGGGYVTARVKVSQGKYRNVVLSRLVLGLAVDDTRVVDHISGEKIDNRRANLRAVPHHRNIAHQAVVNNRGTSKYRNVHWSKSDRRWIAMVKIAGFSHRIGSFEDETAAADAAREFRRQRGLPAGY